MITTCPLPPLEVSLCREQLRYQSAPYILGRETEISQAEAVGRQHPHPHLRSDNKATFTLTSTQVTSTRNTGCLDREAPGAGQNSRSSGLEHFFFFFEGEGPDYMTHGERDRHKQESLPLCKVTNTWAHPHTNRCTHSPTHTHKYRDETHTQDQDHDHTPPGTPHKLRNRVLPGRPQLTHSEAHSLIRPGRRWPC